MKVRSPNIDVRINVESDYHSRLSCPRDRTWIDLVDCVGCQFHAGTLASTEGISVLCRFRRGQRGVTVTATTSGE